MLGGLLSLRSPSLACFALGCACSDNGSSAARTLTKNGNRVTEPLPDPGTELPLRVGLAHASSSERFRDRRLQPGRVGRMGAEPDLSLRMGVGHGPLREFGDSGPGSPGIGAHRAS